MTPMANQVTYCRSNGNRIIQRNQRRNPGNGSSWMVTGMKWKLSHQQSTRRREKKSQENWRRELHHDGEGKSLSTRLEREYSNRLHTLLWRKLFRPAALEEFGAYPDKASYSASWKCSHAVMPSLSPPDMFIAWRGEDKHGVASGAASDGLPEIIWAIWSSCGSCWINLAGNPPGGWVIYSASMAIYSHANHLWLSRHVS